MRVGIQLPEVERGVRWPEYASMARAAEKVGFDSIWVSDHARNRKSARSAGRGLLDEPGTEERPAPRRADRH